MLESERKIKKKEIHAYFSINVADSQTSAQFRGFDSFEFRASGSVSAPKMHQLGASLCKRWEPETPGILPETENPLIGWNNGVCGMMEEFLAICLILTLQLESRGSEVWGAFTRERRYCVSFVGWFLEAVLDQHHPFEWAPHPLQRHTKEAHIPDSGREPSAFLHAIRTFCHAESALLLPGFGVPLRNNVTSRSFTL